MITGLSKRVLIVAGLYAFVLTPLILTYLSGPVAMYVSHFCATVICFTAAQVFIWRTRGSRFIKMRRVAAIAATLCVVWWIFVVYVFMTMQI